MSGAPKLLLVVGVGRSGTSAFSGSAAALGYRMPQPEVKGNPTNPRGFGEPRWLVDFQTALLKRRQVDNFDSRPYAWQMTAPAGRNPENQRLLREWLEGELAQHDRVVVKDPRTIWLFNLWRRVTADLDVDVKLVTMLRPPSEVVASARMWYAGDHFETSRLAGWTNVQLRTEKLTRDNDRAFVMYHDLLRDPIAVMTKLNSSLDLGLELDNQAATDQVRSWLDPGLRHASDDISELSAIDSMRNLADRVWSALEKVASNDNRRHRANLDSLRAEYRKTYLDAELIVHHSIRAQMDETKMMKRLKKRPDETAAAEGAS